MSELDDLLSQFMRLGVPGHVHSGDPAPPCPADEACVSEEEPFSAVVRAPGRSREVHVDTMTAFGVLSVLPDNVGLEAAWAELVAIDRGA